jgi:hypothetical protein
MKYFSGTVLIFALSFFLFIGCSEKPGDPSTTGLKQYIGNGFLFKYQSGAKLDLKGENDWATRTITLSGDLVQFSVGETVFETPSYEIIVEFFDNPDMLDAESFAKNLILERYETALSEDSPTGYWPVSENLTVEGISKKVRGEISWESVFWGGDHEFIRTFIVNKDKAISVGYRSYPIENNPLQPAWHAVYLLTLDSVRLENN